MSFAHLDPLNKGPSAEELAAAAAEEADEEAARSRRRAFLSGDSQQRTASLHAVGAAAGAAAGAASPPPAGRDRLATLDPSLLAGAAPSLPMGRVTSGAVATGMPAMSHGEMTDFLSTEPAKDSVVMQLTEGPSGTDEDGAAAGGRGAAPSSLGTVSETEEVTLPEVVWFWGSGENPDGSHRWSAYAKGLGEKVEAGYKLWRKSVDGSGRGGASAILDVGGGRHADFEKMMQIVTSDQSRMRPIKRTEGEGATALLGTDLAKLSSMLPRLLDWGDAMGYTREDAIYALLATRCASHEAALDALNRDSKTARKTFADPTLAKRGGGATMMEQARPRNSSVAENDMGERLSQSGEMVKAVHWAARDAGRTVVHERAKKNNGHIEVFVLDAVIPEGLVLTDGAEGEHVFPDGKFRGLTGVKLPDGNQTTVSVRMHEVPEAVAQSGKPLEKEDFGRAHKLGKFTTPPSPFRAGKSTWGQIWRFGHGKHSLPEAARCLMTLKLNSEDAYGKNIEVGEGSVDVGEFADGKLHEMWVTMRQQHVGMSEQQYGSKGYVHIAVRYCSVPQMTVNVHSAVHFTGGEGARDAYVISRIFRCAFEKEKRAPFKTFKSWVVAERHTRPGSSPLGKGIRWDETFSFVDCVPDVDDCFLEFEVINDDSSLGKVHVGFAHGMPPACEINLLSPGFTPVDLTIPDAIMMSAATPPKLRVSTEYVSSVVSLPSQFMVSFPTCPNHDCSRSGLFICEVSADTFSHAADITVTELLINSAGIHALRPNTDIVIEQHSLDKIDFWMRSPGSIMFTVGADAGGKKRIVSFNTAACVQIEELLSRLIMHLTTAGERAGTAGNFSATNEQIHKTVNPLFRGHRQGQTIGSVLVLAADQQSALDYTEMLKEANYAVVVVQDGKAAEAEAQKKGADGNNKYGLVLADCRAANLNDFLAANMQAKETETDISLIVVLPGAKHITDERREEMRLDLESKGAKETWVEPVEQHMVGNLWTNFRMRSHKKGGAMGGGQLSADALAQVRRQNATLQAAADHPHGARGRAWTHQLLHSLMAPLKEAVGGGKTRFTEDGFNLNLGYVTPRCIAMGLPAEGGSEGLFRNDIAQVAEFFTKKHPEHYKIYNLCNERSYNVDWFNGSVACFPIEDHNVPTLEMMHGFAQSTQAFLDMDPENVIAVHCKGGKGRTGTMICAHLLYSTAVETRKKLEAAGESTDLITDHGTEHAIGFDADTALTLFQQQRTEGQQTDIADGGGATDEAATEALKMQDEIQLNKGQGVTGMAQRRYVHFYEKMLRQGEPLMQKINFPPKRMLARLMLIRPPAPIAGDEHVGFTIDVNYERKFESDREEALEDGKSALIWDMTNWEVAGDVRIELYVCRDKDLTKKNKEDAKHEELGFVWFHTAFEDGEMVSFNDKNAENEQQVDKRHKTLKFPEGMELRIEFHQ